MRLSIPRRARGIAVLSVMLVVYGVFLLRFRPAQPFEWDEVLFMRAVERFDVADYAPHAPGYPAYVAAVKAVHTLVSDPQLANQLAVVISALGLMAALFLLARRLGGGVREAALALLALGVTPAFAFNANVGLSDVPGAALTVVAVLALVAAWDEPRRAWVAAAAAAVAAGVRPQVVAALLPLGVALLLRLALRRRWKALTGAVAAGAAVSAAFWAPAVLLTGTGRYLEAVNILRTYVRVEELGYRLPQAPIDRVVAFWLGRPFGAPQAAWVFWLLALSGAWWWWRAGLRRLVAVAAGAVLGYLVLAAFTLNFTTAVRYVIPALPFAAVLVAGNLRAPKRLPRLGLTVLLVLWSIAEINWGWRVYELRRSPAPVWACLEWVAGNYDPARTTVVYHGLFAPQAEWVLGRRGFDIKLARPGVIYDGSIRPDGSVVVVYSRPVPGTAVVHEERWRSGRLERLTRDRYYACIVAEATPAAEVTYSTDFQLREHDWELWDIGVVRLGRGLGPRTLTVEPIDAPVYVGGSAQPGRKVEAAQLAEILLLPGEEGQVILRTPRRRHVHLRPLRTTTVRPDSPVVGVGFVVPFLAREDSGPGGPVRSDVFLLNPGEKPLGLTATLLPGDDSGAGTVTVSFELQPGSVEIADVLAHPAWGKPRRAGALLLRSVATGGGGDGGGFFVASRTLPISTDGTAATTARWVRGVPLAAGLGAGRSSRLRGLVNDHEWSERSGVVSLCGAPLPVRFSFLAADGRRLGEQRLMVPPFSQLLIGAPGGGRDVEAVATLDEAPGDCRVFPFAVLVRQSDRAVTVLPADPEAEPASVGATPAPPRSAAR